MQDIDNTFEIIVVDDGSPDNSMSIVNEFTIKNHNIYVVHQDNQGLSSARNTGLNFAKGEYVWFVDSDDQLTSGSLNYLSAILSKNKVDILGFDITAFWENDEYEEKLPAILSCKDQELYHKILTNRDIIHRVHTAPAQRFVFRRNFLEEHHLRFFPGIIHEDVDFMGRATFFANTIYLTNKSLYRYLQRQSGSIMSSLNMRSLESRDCIIDNLIQFRNQYARTLYEKVYINDFMLKILMLMLDFRNEKIESDVYAFLKKHKSSYRKVALQGLLANIYLLSFKKVLRAMMITTNPAIYHKIRMRF